MRLRFIDTPMNRGAQAVRDQFGREKFKTIMAWLFALEEAVEHKAVREWVRKSDEEQLEIADTLVHACAKAHLSFPPFKFRIRIRELVHLANEFERLNP